MFIFIHVFIHSKLMYYVPDIILAAYNIQEGKLVEGFQVVTGKQTAPLWGNLQIWGLSKTCAYTL